MISEHCPGWPKGIATGGESVITLELDLHSVAIGRRGKAPHDFMEKEGEAKLGGGGE